MGLLAFLFGCSDGRPAELSDDDIRIAALKIAMPLPDCSKSWAGGTVERCDIAMTRVSERRKEFDKFEPEWMRKAILRWFDFAERNIKEAREDCVTQASRKEQEAYQVKNRGQEDRVQDILKSIGHR